MLILGYRGVIFELILSNHLIQDSIQIISIFGGQGKYILQLFDTSSIDPRKIGIELRRRTIILEELRRFYAQCLCEGFDFFQRRNRITCFIVSDHSITNT